MTLVELLVVAVVGSFVLMAIYQTLTLQERSARHQRGLITAQQSSRAALELLVAELRELSAVSGDLVGAGEDFLTLRSSRKLGFVCGSEPALWQLDVWERGEPFASGDSVFLFVDGDPGTTADDLWSVWVVADAASVGSSVECPDWPEGSPLPRRRLTLESGSAAEFAGIARGSPVRSYVQQTYGKQLIDGNWVLARQRGEEIVPLIGPLSPDGLRLDFVDGAGDSIDPESSADLTGVNRIEITVRALAPGSVGRAGAVVHTISSHVHLRNH
jgi:hypothetical protein